MTDTDAPSRPEQTAKSIRDTTKWIVASGSGFLALLASAAPISALGSRTFDVSRVASSGSSVVLASGLLVWMLAAALTVLETNPQTLREVLESIDNRPESRESNQLLHELDSNRYFLLHDDFVSVRELWRAASIFGGDRDNLSAIVAAENRVVAYVDYASTARRYRELRRRLRIAAPASLAALTIAVSILLTSPTEADLSAVNASRPIRIAASADTLESLRYEQGCSTTTIDTAILVAISSDAARYVASFDRDAHCGGAVMELKSTDDPFYPVSS